MKLPWRKLYCDPRSSWTRLPLLTRGVGDELLRASDDDGRIVLDGEAPAQVVYRLLAVHPMERRRVREALDELVLAGWVTLTRDAITVHVGEAQPKPKAHPTPTHVEPNPSATRAHAEPNPSPTQPQPERDSSPISMKSLDGMGTALSEREEKIEIREEGERDARAPVPADFVDRSDRERAIVGVLLRLYRDAYERATGSAWMGASSAAGHVEIAARWCLTEPDPEAAAERFVAGAFATPRWRRSRWPWRWLVEDPAATAAASTLPSAPPGAAASTPLPTLSIDEPLPMNEAF